MIHDIKFNSQRDNDSFGGQRMASAQCFPTCSWMFLSHFVPEIDATDDAGLAEFFNEVEDTIIGGSIAEEYKRLHPGRIPNGTPSSIYWDVECYGINKYFEKYGVNKKAVWAEVPFRRLRDILYTSPAIFGTMLTGTGHIILLKGYDNDGFYVNDPWGIATTGYKDHNGDTWYSNDLVKKTGETRTARSDIMRVMYA